MSHDLFAAFGETTIQQPALHTANAQQDDIWSFSGVEPSTVKPAASHLNFRQPKGSQLDDFADDDWGDFEDGSAPTLESAPSQQSRSPPGRGTKSPIASSFPPKAPKKEEPPPPDPTSKIGKHPFADHMDFLFETGEDEYDAGADDLENLASNPEAAMAYSKRIIAEQEARSAQATNSTFVKSVSIDDSRGKSSVTSSKLPQAHPSHPVAHLEQRPRRLTKTQPKPEVQSQQAPNPPPARNKLQKKSGYAPANPPDILFDADNLSNAEDDEFGDFEGETAGPAIATAHVTKHPPSNHSTMPSIDLLGLDEPPKTLGEIGRTKSASIRMADTVLGPPKHTPTNSQTSNTTSTKDNPWADFETPAQISPHPAGARVPNIQPVTPGAPQDDGGWGDFDDFEATEPSQRAAPPAASKTISKLPSIFHSRQTPTPQESSLPPTNIPPPLLLLSTFPSLFSSAQEALFTPLSRLDTPQRQALLSHPATHKFLHTYINQATVFAHIIAGRKLRWKRDQILAQSMRIGPAAAGGKGGMKLAGLDKSELAKEDREVLDAVRLWKAQVGKLRGAVAGAAATKLPSVPEISEQMPVKVLKAVEGGFVAPHACALCGLKREERAAKVDVDVDDSFGEWWVSGTDMHLACKNWWEENRGRLRSR